MMYLCHRRTNICVGMTGKASPKTEPAICRCLNRHREEGLSTGYVVLSKSETSSRSSNRWWPRVKGKEFCFSLPANWQAIGSANVKHKTATQLSFDWRMFQSPFRDTDFWKKKTTNLFLILPTCYNGVGKKLEFYLQGFASLALGFTPKILWGQQFCCLTDLCFHSDSAIRPEDAKTRICTRKANSALGSKAAPAATLMYHLRLEAD